MKILVTGATGFIGYHIIHQLLSLKHDVVATSTDIEKARKQDWFKSVCFIEHTVGKKIEADNLYKKFEEPDIAIHLAWEGLPNYKSSIHIEKNLPDQYLFVLNLVQNGLKDIAIAGTCLEYGMQAGCLSENMDSVLDLPYAVAKNMLRNQLEALQQQMSFQLKWIRLFYMYGARQNPNALISQLDIALAKGEEVFNMSGGEQERDYLPVEKVAANIIAIATQKKITGIINCCSGKPVKLRYFVEEYLREKNKSIRLNLGYYPYADYEPMRFWGDVTKLNSIIQKI